MKLDSMIGFGIPILTAFLWGVGTPVLINFFEGRWTYRPSIWYGVSMIVGISLILWQIRYFHPCKGIGKGIIIFRFFCAFSLILGGMLGMYICFW